MLDAARPCRPRRGRRRRTARRSARRVARTMHHAHVGPVGADDQLARRSGSSSTGCRRRSSGSVSSKMRPLDRASVIIDDSRVRCRRRCRAAWLPCARSRGRGGRCGRRRLALGDQPGDHQAGRGAQVGGHHRRAGQPLARPATTAVLPSTSMFAPRRSSSLHVHEAVLEDRLGDHRRALRRSQFSAMNCACMSVGKAGVRAGAKADCAASRPCACTTNAVVDARSTLDARLAQLVDHRLEVIGARRDAAPRRRRSPPRRTGRCRPRCGRDDAWCVPPCSSLTPWTQMRLVPAPSMRAPIAFSISCQIVDLRLVRGVLEHRRALGQRRRHHQVLGAGDRDHVDEDAARRAGARVLGQPARRCSRARRRSPRPSPAGP